MTLPALYGRFIPTCVGNTIPCPPWHSRWSVHPHVRGEYVSEPPVEPASCGSSPRAWGIRPRRGHRGAKDRFIPTCVGNTAKAPRWFWHVPVHPHVRGEYPQLGEAPYCLYGSSPRAWGIQLERLELPLHGRFIPTCVGNTRINSPDHENMSVHPHVRGEYLGFLHPADVHAGSSPRAWGIRLGQLQRVRPARFIPTCVGNTRIGNSHGNNRYGSSPRAWGILRPDDSGDGDPRFIPTCVGNTPCATWSGSRATVHPHVRGEYCWP